VNQYLHLNTLKGKIFFGVVLASVILLIIAFVIKYIVTPEVKKYKLKK